MKTPASKLIPFVLEKLIVLPILGYTGHMLALNKLDHNIFYWIVAVVIGGLIGSFLGTIKFNNKIIITCLFLVLLSAGIKFLLI